MLHWNSIANCILVPHEPKKFEIVLFKPGLKRSFLAYETVRVILMCGIVGALTFDGSSFTITKPYITRMRDTMRHRGPDGEGLWISNDGAVGFGHRRLSIIDLSKSANQPMSNETGSCWLTFNGEIYNHASIRAELVGLGHRHWKTDHSDTEVIVRAFEEWGIACLERFRGMFAIGLWDDKSKYLWLARDRIGVKPLYYSIHHNRITFASEIKALLEDPDQARAVNEEAIYHYLSFLTTPAPQTMFRGIRKLPPGTWLRIDSRGNVQEKCYWDVWDHTEELRTTSETEIAERLLTELRTAVSLRKVSDVPVGVFLSGGIDSSANAALFSEGETRPIRTFTIGYQGEYKTYQNEIEYARFMAKQVGSEHHELMLTQEDLLGFLPRMVQLQDEPIGDPVCVPVYFVSKLARDNGVIVCQLGEGADELFCGYPTWKLKRRLQLLNDRIPVPAFLKKLGLRSLRVLGKSSGHAYEALRRGCEGLPVFWGGVDAFTEEEKRRLLSTNLIRNMSGITSWEAIRPLWDRFQNAAWEVSPLQWMSYLDLKLRLPELLLMRVDKMSMGVSLEGRVPFLDHKFVEFCMSIPESVKTRHGILKYILKKAVRGVVPDELLRRKKQGFGVPVYEWFFDKLGGLARQELVRFCAESGLLNQKEVMSIVDKGQGSRVWYLLNLALWWREYICRVGPAEELIPAPM